MLIPEENEKDLPEIPDNVKDALEIIPVANVRDVLKHALAEMPEPIEWDEGAEEGRSRTRRQRCERREGCTADFALNPPRRKVTGAGAREGARFAVSVLFFRRAGKENT